MKLVLLPGLDGTGLLFRPLIDSLPIGTDVLIVSYPTDKFLGYSELVNFVLRQFPSDEDFILIGESFSGPIAYQIALLKPKNLKSVIFVASFLDNPRKFMLILFCHLPLRLLLSLPIPNLIVRRFLLGTAADKSLISLFKQSLREVPASVLSYRLGEIAGLSLHHKEQRCDIRATYIQATEDKLVPVKCVEAFEDLLKNLNIVQVNGPHFILQANPTACAEIIVNEIRLLARESS